MFKNTFKVGFVYLVLLVTLALTNAQAQNSPVKNIVLVHGAWADGSGWKGVYDILSKDGYNVSMGAGTGDDIPGGCRSDETRPRPARWTVHSCRSQLW